jgi:branched-chain amino acid transport system ATP-binding protein
MANTILKAEGISRRFGGLAAVNDVDIHVNPGEILGIIGPNGAGKTTFFNIITGVDKPTTGKVFFEGVDVTGWPIFAMARLGMVRTFQRSMMFHHMTVLETVLVGIYARSYRGPANLHRRWLGIGVDETAARARAMELLELAGLAHRADAMAGALPYGDQRRLEVARAMMTDPKVLMLDEPAAGLSREETAVITEMLSQLRAQGHSVIIIEHNLSMIMRLCDRVAVLNHGVKIIEGTAAEVRASPAVIEAYIGTRKVHA